MAQVSGTYTVEQGMALARASRLVRNEHLLLAARQITQKLTASNIPYALMGGFSLSLRGSRRDTFDVDIAAGCNMLQLIQAVSNNERILRPLGPMSGVLRLFVQVESGNEPEIHVMVDLILQGSLGAPSDLRTSSEAISINTETGPQTFAVLNIKSIAESKLGAFFARGSSNDFTDIQFLILTFPEKVYEIRAGLDQTHRQHFANIFAQKRTDPSGRNLLKRVKQVLGVV
ncbi:hypothetical protein LOZ53_003154 [Ophidiomyces ophidiicola]|uniref:Uncharacterized protein n=1 Tax=Ophidiomyces ophidiicola TaxID=1387563 RepID=A0ACB8US34_9EURO|nr:uncharacterized protein LOZ57_001086 [Ophidiomyces ophidiicola]KAI1916867.1 hypothetical protein LOZ61_000769 [Ophidiomyces ophidiicola]KAI1917028.1 hypothetical protein LOZ64_003179 [Ophidiomyces ophidiicola]KAI1926743.1 hypothetical protein LOZ60_003446 [Ophidiomyces ophidiicola]KAI1947702.1 hypothetical protein LOZ62_002912 [Ophidiomyces ophidiicola]KAI1951675.1 hypothetical protein LOZ57_001086 [Ophidiomyces ophidiicola]